MRQLTLGYFFLTLRTGFLMCLVPYIHIFLCYFLILCFYLHRLFLTLLATRHILQFTMFDSISLQLAPTKCSNSNIFVVQRITFSSLLVNLLYFLFSFWSCYRSKSFFSYHILMKICSMTYNYFVTKQFELI